MLDSMDAILPPLKFPSLKSLSLVFPEASAEVELDAHGSAAVNGLLDGVAPTLARLSISGDAIWRRASFSCFRSLQEMELIFTSTFGGLHNVLAHCTTITSLTLLPSSSAHQLFAALDAHPNALPCLTTFKFLNHMQLEMVLDAHVQALCKFLQNKKHLRRLDVLLDGPERAEILLLESLSALRSIEVLGIDFVRYDWQPEDILAFERVIPPRLSALRLQPVADELHAPYKEAWLAMVRLGSLVSTQDAYMQERRISDLSSSRARPCGICTSLRPSR